MIHGPSGMKNSFRPNEPWCAPRYPDPPLLIVKDPVLAVGVRPSGLLASYSCPNGRLAWHKLTHSGFGLMVPMMAATGTATLVAFHVDGYSIYSARLPAYAADSAPAAPAGNQADHRQ